MSFAAPAGHACKQGSSLLPAFPGQSRTHAIVEALGKSIVSGCYPVEGTTVTEAELCHRFDVARGTLREAVRVLRGKGLVELRPRYGLWVQPEECWSLFDPDIMRWLLERKPSLMLVSELTQMRLAMQPAAASQAAREFCNGGRPDRRLALNRAIDDVREMGTVSRVIGFHVAVLRATHNRFFAQSADFVRAAICLNDRYLKGGLQASVLDPELFETVGQRVLSADHVGAEHSMRALIECELALLGNKTHAV